MIALAWSFFMVLSMLLASSQAFLAAPVPGYEHGLTSSSTAEPGVEKRPLAAMPALGGDDDDDDDSEEDYAMGPLPPPPPVGSRRNDEQTVYVFHFDEVDAGKGEGHRNRNSKDLSDDNSDGQSPLDPWSIVWYIGSFGGLVAFFLIVSCSEWCCRRGARPLTVPYTQRGEVINAQPATESPPPPYHLFAPPPYDSVNYADLAGDNKTAHQQPEKLDIYVITVPVHNPTAPQPQQQQQQQLPRQQQQHPPA